MCDYNGHTTSCRDRVEWLEHNEHKSCGAAHAKVIAECPVCRGQCSSEDMGCQEDEYDCHSGWANWEQEWSVNKRVWCCRHVGNACPEGPHDCEAGWANWQNSWSMKKKTWCCFHQGKGCGDEPPVEHGCDTSCDYNGHSTSCRQRVEWLLKYDHKTCPAAFAKVMAECPVCRGQCSPEELGCRGGDQGCDTVCDYNGHSTCRDRVDWLVKNEHKNCRIAHAKVLAECPVCRDQCSPEEAGCLSGKGCDTRCDYNGHSSSCQDRIDWLVDNQHLRCFVAHGKVMEECPICRGQCLPENAGCEGGEFDCNAGWANWRAGWSVDKRAWCCKNDGKGCVQGPYDCAAGYANWQAGWSTDKKTWCCYHEGKGCESCAPRPDLYDCAQGWANWQQGWHQAQKQWCCEHAGKGCPQAF